MHSLFPTWTGLFRYHNPMMPLVQLTATFEDVGANKFGGFISETPIILPDGFDQAFEFKKPSRLTCWGSIACDVMEGELVDKQIPNWGQEVHFLKASDQLSGYPVFCRGGFNAAAGLIVGVWGVVEGDNRCNLPLNLKIGHFTLRKQDGGRKDAPRTAAPVTPELLCV